MFIQCIDGGVDYGRCDDGYLFDSKSQKCELEELVDCGTREFYYFGFKGPIPIENYSRRTNSI